MAEAGRGCELRGRRSGGPRRLNRQDAEQSASPGTPEGRPGLPMCRTACPVFKKSGITCQPLDIRKPHLRTQNVAVGGHRGACRPGRDAGRASPTEHEAGVC